MRSDEDFVDAVHCGSKLRPEWRHILSCSLGYIHLHCHQMCEEVVEVLILMMVSASKTIDAEGKDVIVAVPVTFAVESRYSPFHLSLVLV